MLLCVNFYKFIQVLKTEGIFNDQTKGGTYFDCYSLCRL